MKKESNKDYIGKKYNDWEVINWVQGKKGIEWICRCKCGTIKQQKVDNIKNGRSKMCKQCCAATKRKEKSKEERIIKIRFNNHKEWSKENTYIGTYKEFLNECKRRKEEKNQKKEEESKEKIRQNKIDYYEREIEKKYGKLKVIDIIIPKKGNTLFKCQCECGNQYIEEARYIKQGNIISCGCISKEKRENAICYKRLYKIYLGMKRRCYNSKSVAYKNYGGRGIKICDEWLNDYKSFEKWAYKNGYNEKAATFECTIDRINNDGNYEPNNCRWVSMKIQNQNKRKRKPTKKYKIYDKEFTIKEIEEKYHISYQLFNYRINHGMTNEEAIEKERKKRN